MIYYNQTYSNLFLFLFCITIKKVYIIFSYLIYQIVFEGQNKSIDLWIKLVINNQNNCWYLLRQNF